LKRLPEWGQSLTKTAKIHYQRLAILGRRALLSPAQTVIMRRFLMFAAKALISAGLLYLAFRKIDFSTVGPRFSQISPSWMILAIAVTLLQLFLGAIRWRELSAYAQAPLGLRQAMRFNLIGAFFNQTLPSTIGGDAVRLWLVGRTGAGWRAATYSVLVDRAIGMIALALIITISLRWSYDLISNAKGQLVLVVMDVVAISGGLVFLALGQLPWKWLRTWWLTRDITACSVIADRAIFNLKRGPITAVVSLLIHVFAVIIAWCAARSINAPVTFEQTFLLIPPIMLITMLPISMAGWGVRENAMMFAFGYAGLPSNDGFIVSLLFGFAYFIVGAIGGIVWIMSAEKRIRQSEPAFSGE
jgi:uncharacterized membrane protein YbhN (UPF0104 family)